MSNVCLLCAVTLLAFYADDRCATTRLRLGERAVIAAAVFPPGCFFRLAYSESTFFVLSVLLLYAINRRWPVWATTLVVAVATAARPVGVALLAPLAIYAWEDCRGSLTRTTLWLAIGCTGLMSFSAWQWLAFGEPLAFAKTQQFWYVRTPAAWSEKIVPLLTLEPLWSVYRAGPRPYWAAVDDHGLPWLSLQFANPLFFVGALVLVAVGWRRRWLNRYDVAMAIPLLAIPYFTRSYEMGMGSSGRFVAVVVPVYIAAAHLVWCLQPVSRALVTAFSVSLMLSYSALYAAGYLIF